MNRVLLFVLGFVVMFALLDCTSFGNRDISAACGQLPYLVRYGNRLLILRSVPDDRWLCSESQRYTPDNPDGPMDCVSVGQFRDWLAGQRKVSAQ